MMRYVLFLSLLIIVSCHEREKTPSQNETSSEYKPDTVAVELNNRAVKLMTNAIHDSDLLRDKFYDSAIVFLDQAIAIDSLYLTAYTNKAQVLQRKGLLQQALDALNRAETIKPDFAEVITAQGFILEKMGKIEFANQKYSQALKVYESKLTKDPKSDKTQSDIAFLYIFTEDKNAAIDEIQNLILENPESQQLQMMERVIENFDRKKFIEEY